MNTEETENAIKYLYAVNEDLRGDAKIVALNYARIEQNKLIAAWSEWLVKEYASNFPESVQDKIYWKAWEDGHAYGLREVESYYEDLCDFAQDVIDGTR